MAENTRFVVFVKVRRATDSEITKGPKNYGMKDVVKLALEDTEQMDVVVFGGRCR